MHFMKIHTQHELGWYQTDLWINLYVVWINWKLGNWDADVTPGCSAGGEGNQTKAWLCLTWAKLLGSTTDKSHLQIQRGWERGAQKQWLIGDLARKKLKQGHCAFSVCKFQQKTSSSSCLLTCRITQFSLITSKPGPAFSLLLRWNVNECLSSQHQHTHTDIKRLNLGHFGQGWIVPTDSLSQEEKYF